MPNGRAQRVGQKNGVTCLLIMFTPRVMVTKLSLNFLYFVLMTGKYQSQFGQKDTLKAFDNFKNKQKQCVKYYFLICKSMYSQRVFDTLYNEIKHKC